MAISTQHVSMVKKMSFKSLVGVVSEQCQEIKQALSFFPYFDSWGPDLVSECCRVSSLAEFPPDEIILGADTGNSHTVYFMLEGVGKIVQNLFVQVQTNSLKETKYQLERFLDSKTSSSETENEGYSSRLFQALQKESKAEEGYEAKKAEEEQAGDSEAVESITEEKPVKAFMEEQERVEIKGEESFGPDHHINVLRECERKRKEKILIREKTRRPEKKENVKTIFMEVGFLFKGACFELDKCERANTIMSVTTVKCLKIPERFLLQHSPCNIWKRIRLFHSLYLPKEKEIFENFKSHRIWSEWKKKQTEQIVSIKNLPNSTLLSFVPYSIRLTYAH